MADDAEYGLVMPFLPVASRGGPFDDRAFVAGWHMGSLYALLEGTQPTLRDDSIPTACVEQADLIALKYGYTARFEDSGVEGWTYMWLTRNADA